MGSSHEQGTTLEAEEGEPASARFIVEGAPRMRLPRAALLLTAVVLAGACSTPHRPYWERVAAPSKAPPADQAAASAGVPATADGRAQVERAPLPPPAAAKPANASSAAASRPPSAAAGQSASAAAGQSASAAATYATVRAVPAEPAPVRPLVDPAWLGVETYTARHEDTLIDVAPRYGLGFFEVAVANPGVDPWLPGEGTTVVLPKIHLPPDGPRQGIVLNLAEQRLFLFEGGKLVRSFPIGIGREGHDTPLGKTTIVRKMVNPTWYPTASARADDPELPAAVPPGPDNPLGSRAMYLGWGSYLIHSTNKEFSIGRPGSRGCIRMYPPHAEALFERVAVGTLVTAVDQPVKIDWIGNELYVEASPSMAQVREWEDKRSFGTLKNVPDRQQVSKKAGAAASRIDWAAYDRVVAEHRGIPTRITTPSEAPAPGPTVKTAAADEPSEDFVGWLRRVLGSGS